MQAHGLRAPARDGVLLAEPPLANAPEVIAANRARLDAWDHDFQGRPAKLLREQARGEITGRAREFLERMGLDAAPSAIGPLVVTGHQPELFHPGVWIKNFAAALVATRSGGSALNLIVDNDVPKGPTIRVPGVGPGGELDLARMEYDQSHGEIPHEDLAVVDEATFASFGERVHDRLQGLVADPLIDEFWPRARAAARLTDRAGLRFAVARRSLEQAWGIRNLEVPESAVCETDGFRWFACHLLAHLPRFQAVHNDALSRYRRLYRIRSHHHPVPELGRQGDWLEAPFWVWRSQTPRRRPLLARQVGAALELRIRGEESTLLTLPLAPDRDACCAVEALGQLPGMGVRLRTRALTTTMFARHLLGDVFLHGIGGAKYDELGDAVARDFLGFEPPIYLTLSQTLWLGLDFDDDADGRLAAAARGLRDLTYNPDRHLDPCKLELEARAWLERKAEEVASEPATHPGRLARFRAIRACNEALQPWVAEQRRAREEARARLEREARRASLARSREYSIVLHSASRLRRAFAEALPGLFGSEAR